MSHYLVDNCHGYGSGSSIATINGMVTLVIPAVRNLRVNTTDTKKNFGAPGKYAY